MKQNTLQVDVVFKALADPTRRQIISLLATSKHTVKELTAAFEMSQPAVSQHLRELRSARLVDSERIGIQQQYRLTGEPLQIVYDWSAQYRRLFDPAGHAWTLVAGKPSDTPAGRKGGSGGR